MVFVWGAGFVKAKGLSSGWSSKVVVLRCYCLMWLGWICCEVLLFSGGGEEEGGARMSGVGSQGWEGTDFPFMM